jgi:hypothetical protein
MIIFFRDHQASELGEGSLIQSRCRPLDTAAKMLEPSQFQRSWRLENNDGSGILLCSIYAII